MGSLNKYERSQVEKYAHKLRDLPELSDLSSRPEISVSFPVPSISDHGSKLLNYFHYPSYMASEETVQIGRPFTRVIVASDTFEVLSFTADDPFPEIPTVFPVSRHVKNVDPQVMRLQVERFYSYYDVALKWFPDKPISSIGPEFRDLFSEFVHSALRPFYKVLNPKFMKWIHSVG
jgi:hypothetical protein